MNVVCLVIDRLQAGYVGAYGNTWIETPNLDRLACQSFLLEHALIDSPDLERLYRSYWQGWHALCPAPPPETRPSLPALLREAGATTVLLSDEPLLARHPGAEDFDELIEIDPPWQPETARRIDQTQFSRCFERAIDRLASLRGPFMLWCHLGGLGTTWDAPLEFRQAYREPGDPPPPEGAEVHERTLPPDCDPDELLGISQSYAGQVSLLDACLGAFLDLFDGLPDAGETLLTVTSSRGFPLGEHRRVGPCDDSLFGELVHVPWMIRFPDAAGAGKGVRNRLCKAPSGPFRQTVPDTFSGAAARSQALVEPADLWATLLDWWELDDVPDSPSAESILRLVRRENGPFRDRLCIAGRDGGRAIRTPAWFFLAGDPPKLFAKPDDRWEVNDVTSLCPEVTECLRDALAQYEQTLSAGRIADLPALSDILVNGLE
ncbi:MAG: sulfatase-like hydrolase/transferase [Planctomycetes bacterium]|nr:sulfatase-like hydrolase/transferase [Planctomycetota bacterium]MCG2683754.1 sulfatase-like hydrolase/transferase [Planctomycetales bacterium]